jgi:hypothetical protein
MLLFALAVAPTAFRVLPSPELAGRVVGPVLASLHLYGMGAGIAIAGLTLALGRGTRLALLALLLSLVCLYSHFGVTAQIAELRDAAFGAEATVEAQLRWARLHRLSMGLFAATGLATLILALLHARHDTFSPGGESRIRVPAAEKNREIP